MAKLECFIGAVRAIVEQVVHGRCGRACLGGTPIPPFSSRVGQDTGTTSLDDSRPGRTATVLAHPVAIRRPLTVCADMESSQLSPCDISGDTGHRRTPDSHNHLSDTTPHEQPVSNSHTPSGKTRFAPPRCHRPCCLSTASNLHSITPEPAQTALAHSFPTDAKEREKGA